MRGAIVLFSDAKRFPAAAFVASRAAALKNRSGIDVILFTNDPPTVASAQRTRWPFTVALLTLPRHVWLAPHYYRLFIPPLLRQRYKRLLYLDDDVYLEDRRAFALFGIDMAGHAVGAVRDIGIAFSPDAVERQRAVRTAGHKYLNSGVLLIDCAKYVERGVTDRLRFLTPQTSAGLAYYDQTALNMILDGDWLEMSPAFNSLAAALDSELSRAFKPSIVHFAGPRKPWLTPNRHPTASADMAAFFRASPWPRFFSTAALGPPPPVPRREQPEDISDEVRSYITETAFADVVAGITPPPPRGWPARSP